MKTLGDPRLHGIGINSRTPVINLGANLQDFFDHGGVAGLARIAEPSPLGVRVLESLANAVIRQRIESG